MRCVSLFSLPQLPNRHSTAHRRRWRPADSSSCPCEFRENEKWHENAHYIFPLKTIPFLLHLCDSDHQMSQRISSFGWEEGMPTSAHRPRLCHDWPPGRCFSAFSCIHPKLRHSARQTSRLPSKSRTRVFRTGPAKTLDRGSKIFKMRVASRWRGEGGLAEGKNPMQNRQRTRKSPQRARKITRANGPPHPQNCRGI
jgi:hypothetical protein